MKNIHKEYSVHHNSKEKIYLVNPDVEKKFKAHMDRYGLKFKDGEYQKKLGIFSENNNKVLESKFMEYINKYGLKFKNEEY